jgi:NADH pyrophosphatase NudC (nudix superfamily)
VRSPDVAQALADPRTAVVLTRLADGHVHVRGGGPDLGPLLDVAHLEPVLVAPGVVAAFSAEDPPADPDADVYADARSALLAGVAGAGVQAMTGTAAGTTTGTTASTTTGTGADPAQRLLGAVAFGQWRARTLFCPRCGGVLDPRPGGRVLTCPAGHQEFPRIEPAVIMRVVDADDRILLARQRTWVEGRVSVLAGFVDPGEALEDAVRREVLEEVGVGVDAVAYVRSQPWPFPSSLMLAFSAAATDTRLRLQDDEIAEARWFTRDDLRAAMADRVVAVPPPLSVAHQLIRQWLGRPLGDERLATWTAARQ